MRWTLALIGPLAGLLWAGPLAAQPTKAAPPAQASPSLIGLELVKIIKPLRGFIDDPFMFDGAGGRLVYVNADAGYMAELITLDLTQGAVQLGKLDLSKVTTTPVDVRLVDDGYFVISRPAKDQPAKAALLDAKGTVKRSFGPADDIALIRRDGDMMVVAYSAAETIARGKDAPEIHHTITLSALDGKRRYGKPRVLVADDKGYVRKLDFRINHWAEGYTHAVGIKGGSWDAKEDQRSPDQEARYDLVTGVFSQRKDIADVIENAHLMRTLAEHGNEAEFLAVSQDLSRLELVTQSARTAIGLAEPLQRYDHKSLQYQPSHAGDGVFFFSLKIDPLNPEAAARKKADLEYMDLYEYRVGEAKATRRARILIVDKRRISWRASGEYWVLVPRLVGFDRGGKELQIYKLAQ